ncbi:AAA family ATPase [Coleofasciculus sp. E2-BRE-01]|uniref:AAA family ATPase n=1 Tax=Coleofasciculus sp. E2-BRE-01 TaxID=3069524 RepID=UPI0032FEDDFA
MLVFPDYQTQAQVYESANSLVYRAIRTQDSQPVILKLLKQDYPTPEELVRYRQEYDLTHHLNLEGVCRSLSLEPYQNTLVIVFEDFGGESLRQWMNQYSFTLEDFLQIAIATTTSLAQVHAANIIHKDINPANIVYNPNTKQLKLIDFGISTVLSRETPTLKNPNVLEGTLAYMSPEQTGRMNRSLDYRTDFYSLGATFYELLTGKLPFETTDVLELVHCHLAKQPIPPHELVGAHRRAPLNQPAPYDDAPLPTIISEIVMKLMAKTAEERYQSALGIKADLEECQRQVHEKCIISNFPLACHDSPDKFQIPQKLYGREREIEQLISAFERVSERSEVMLVVGYSGIGKSALVQELYKPVTQKRGYFISGKFDQYQRGIPYSGIVNAFQELVKQLLTEPEAQLQEWREKILSALGVNGQVIIDVIPEVEWIIGKPPEIPELGATEAQNRFNLVFQNFINVFTDTSHPLALFIDDLQWADGASLKLIQVLMSAASPGLFLIGAYRDNEVFPAHPLMLMLEEITKAGSIVNQISLSPLDLPTVTQLICDTLNCSEDRAKSLAKLVDFKTGGNPFFMNEFLTSLYTEGLLEFTYSTLSNGEMKGQWQWDLEQINSLGFTDNVVELMASKIQKLPESTQHLLKIAACIGNQFDLKTLASSCEKSLQDTANELHGAVASSLVIPLGSREDVKLALIESESTNYQPPEYKFVHDRIQQAAYSLISEEHKPVIHQQIGQLLLQNTPKERREAKLFEIVNQLNLGKKLISNQSERNELAQLNLQAGKKAKASAAYHSGFNYLKFGMKLLKKNGWQLQYCLALALYKEAAEVTYLIGDFEKMNRFIKIVLQNAKNILDSSSIIEIKIIALTNQNKLELAINTAIKFLEKFGIYLPNNPNKIDAFVFMKKTKIALCLKSHKKLIDLPTMTNPSKLAAIRILVSVQSATFRSLPNLYTLIVCQQVILSIQYGNTSSSAFGYACYAQLINGIEEDFESGYRFGKLALSLFSKFNSSKLESQVLTIVNAGIVHWKESINKTLYSLKKAYLSGIENGNFSFAAHAAFLYSYHSYIIGINLVQLEQEMACYGSIINKLKQPTILTVHKMNYQVVLNLLGLSDNPCSLIGKYYDEEQMLPFYLTSKDRSAAYRLFLHKTTLFYLFEEYRKAYHYAKLAEQYLDGAIGTVAFSQFYFYYSLILTSLLGSIKNNRDLSIISKNINKIKKWSNFSRINYLHKFYLVEAERYRVLGKDFLAADYYDRAIALAKENDYINEAALAYELAAKFYLSQGKELIARAYMQEARYWYQRWGAKAKVKDLETRYSQLLSINQSINQSEIKDNQIVTTQTGSRSTSHLDIATVMKASQAISGEIVLEKLLSSLMKILIENVGAQKGYLILEHQGQLLIEATGSIDSEQVTLLQSIPVANSQVVSQAIVNYVARTKDSVVLNDATREGNFTHDAYIQDNQPKSILCFPLIDQGQLVSIVYLENNLTTGAFTAERVELLKLLSGQAAISIQNSQLFTDIRKLNKAYERFVPNQFLQFLQKNSIVDVELGNQVQLEMSVLFSDIRGFTSLSEKMTPEDNFKFINSYLSRMEPAITEHQGFIDKYIGDAIMALFSGEADNAVKAGIAMLHRLTDYNEHRVKSGYKPIQNGIGINTGYLMLGTVGGQNRMDGTVISDAVNLASRIESLTKEYGVSLLISQHTFSRLQNPTNYDIRQVDRVKVKGKSEFVIVYEVFDADFPDIKDKKLATLQTYTEACSYYNLNAYKEAAQGFEECLRQNSSDRVAQIYLKRCQAKL